MVERALLELREYVPCPRHGTWYAKFRVRYWGEVRARTMLKYTRCVCGEPVLMQDPVVPYKPGSDDPICHINCKDLLKEST